MELIHFNPHPNIHGYTTTKAQKNLSFTVGEDSKTVLQNRQELVSKLNLDLNDFIFARQCHSDKVVKVTSDDRGKGAYDHESGIPDVDGIYTFDKDVVLAFFHADCVPILLHDPVSGLIGAIHAGWQGTLKEILYKGLMKIKNQENVDLSNLLVYVGPCLSFESSAIDHDLQPYLVDSTFDKTPYIKATPYAYKIDMRALTMKMLELAGVPSENVTNYNEDTCTLEDKYFSFQRSRTTGRHLTFITSL